MLSSAIARVLVFAFLTGSCIKREFCAPGESIAGAQSEVPPGTPTQVGEVMGKGLLGRALSAFELHGDEKQKATVKLVQVDGQAFAEAVHAQTRESVNSAWGVQIQAPTNAPVEQGDLLLATFHVRSTEMAEGGRAETEFVFERAGSPYTKSVSYPVPVRPEWRKVQIPFAAAETYAPGTAQVIFRLGYEPQSIEIANVSLETFAKNVQRWSLPSTLSTDKKLLAEPISEPPITVTDGGELAFTVAPAKGIGSISPLVYGVNSQNATGTGATVRRMGGNRQSAYNWELNASSAGSDWEHLNDDWPCTVLGYKDCDKPGAQKSNFIEENQRAKLESIVTIPLLDWVSADKGGSVKDNEKAPSPRYVRSELQKQGALSLVPKLDDGVVYQDELVNFLVQKHGRAARGGAEFYSLDNEPALWPSTHPRVHPEKVTYAEVMRRTEAAASAITRLDPTAAVLGGVMFGWSEFMTLSVAPDSAENNEKHGGTYIDFFLSKSKELEKKHGRRLIHVLDVHWYPEARGHKRITESDVSQKTIDARLLAPRSLWDGTHHEKSWIGNQLGKPIRLIPWLREKIAERYPGTKLSMTEYNFGAGEHISGGLAQVDVLGIFGREGMFMANYWGNGPGNGELPPFIRAAFQLYRNYDGKGGVFGDSAVQATATNLDKASIYAATDAKKPGTMTVLVINKDQRANYQGKIQLESGTRYAAADVFVLDGRSPSVRADKAVTIENNLISVTLPALSATLLVCRTR